MKREEIERLGVGDSTDVLVGRLMGLRDIRPAWAYWCPDGPIYFDDNHAGDCESCFVYTNEEYDDMEGLPPYSTSVGVAWGVAESLSDFQLIREEGQYSVGCITPEYGMHWANAETAPLAICRLALLVTLYPKGPQ